MIAVTHEHEVFATLLYFLLQKSGFKNVFFQCIWYKTCF